MIEIFVGLIIIWLFRNTDDKPSQEERYPYMYDHFDNYDGGDSQD